MKYKILLMGSNETIIDDVFELMGGSFELMTTSRRMPDVSSHVKYFVPDAVIYCPYDEDVDSAARFTAIYKEVLSHKIPVILIGNPVDCEDFNTQAPDIAGMTLEWPLPAVTIRTRLNTFLEQYRNSRELIAKLLEDDEETSRGSGKERQGAAAPSRETADLKNHVDKPEEFIIPESVVNPIKSYGTKTILVVDDDILMVKLIKRHLEDEYNVATATSGSIALRYLQKRQVDLVLLDYEMPKMNGPEVLDHIREGAATREIPVVFLTGAAERDKIEMALSKKPQGYLLKPVNRDMLIKKVKSLIG